MKDINKRVLPTGYHTLFLSIFNSCNYYYKLFDQDFDRTILICKAEDKDKLTKDNLEDDDNSENEEDDT
ncbi:19541_t:CDS:2, partial [Cetraspora pellucida]